MTTTEFDLPSLEGRQRACCQIYAAVFHAMKETMRHRHACLLPDSKGVTLYPHDDFEIARTYESRVLRRTVTCMCDWLARFIRLLPHDLHSDVTHDDFVHGQDHGKRMLIKEKHLMPCPSPDYDRLNGNLVRAYNGLWCTGGRIAHIMGSSLRITVHAFALQGIPLGAPAAPTPPPTHPPPPPPPPSPPPLQPLPPPHPGPAHAASPSQPWCHAAFFDFFK